MEQKETKPKKVCRSMDRIKDKIKAAIKKDDLAKVQSLARKACYNFADPKLKNYKLLREALYLEDSDIAMWLLEQNCPVNGKSLKVAIENFHNKIVSIMLERGARPDGVYTEGEYNPFQEACNCENIEAIKLILASAEPNIVDIQNEDGFTAVHVAVLNENLEILNLLLKCNPNLELTIERWEKIMDFTALHLAVDMNVDKKVIEALLNAGADINAEAFTINNVYDVEPINYTPLDLAIKSCNFKLAELLLMHNAKFSRDDIDVLIEQKQEFIKHIVLLKSTNKSVHPNILTMISQFNNFEKIEKPFTSEIENMKKTKIIDGISFYDILSKQSNALASYGKNKELLQAVTSRADISEEFPHYYEQFIDQLVAAQKRAHALRNCLLIFNEVLTQEICKKIFDYLDLEDLDNIIAIKDFDFMDVNLIIPRVSKGYDQCSIV